jgi:hypothetical protein
VTGATNSQQDFPLKDPLQPFYGGGSSNAFVTRLTAPNNALNYSTFLGGTGADVGRGIAIKPRAAACGAGAEPSPCDDDAVVTGFTSSTDFPVVVPFQPTNNGGFDAFVSQVSDCACTPKDLTVTGTASHEIDLSWVDYCPDFTDSFELLWLADDGTKGSVMIPAGQYTYQHMGLTPGIYYHYQILAHNDCCDSKFSNKVKAVPLP